MKEFVIGDLHFFDKNIIRFGCRPFQSVLEMNEMLIKNWNGVVNKNDVVYVIGDFFDFGNCNIQDIHNTIAQLNGTIVLIVGNHDLPYVENLRTLITVIDYPIVKDGFWILSHEPMYVSMNTPYANIFAHVHKNPMYRDVSPRSFCASAERINYTPILLQDVYEMVRNAFL